MTLRLLMPAIGLAFGGVSILGGIPPSASSAEPPREGRARATFAGGCFWCMEPPFDNVPGVVSTTSGYAGGVVVAPTYEQVSAGVTGHAEAVQVAFDLRKVSYEQLLEVFWKNIDPLDGGAVLRPGEPVPRGDYWEDDDQKRAALASRERSRIRASCPDRS